MTPILAINMTLRDWLLWLARGRLQTTKYQVATNVTVTEATAGCAVSPQGQDVGILLSSVLIDNANVGTVTLTIQLSDGSVWDYYIPATTQVLNPNILTRGILRYKLVNGSPNTISATIESVSVDEFTYRQILRDVSHVDAGPFEVVKEPAY